MPLRFRPSLLAVALAFLLPCAPVPAQTATSQEQLQRERERALRQQQEAHPDVRLGTPSDSTPRSPPPAWLQDEQPCRRIDTITLEGDAAEVFRFALDAVRGSDDGAIGRCLGSHGINQVLARVQNAVIARGYTTTRILAMPQDLGSGTLVLSVIPGRVHEMKFTPGSDRRGTMFNAMPVSKGDILDLRDIEQGLENFKRVPTAEADIQITPAEDNDAPPGASDLLIHYRQRFPFRVSTTLDDAGGRAMGKYQAGATLAYDHWWTLNDLFYVNLNRSLGCRGGQDGSGKSGSNSYTLHYSLPFGYWMLAATMSGSRYHQTVAGAFDNFVYSGRTETTELKLSRVVYRDGMRKSTLYLKTLLRTASNAIDGTRIGPQQRRTTAWEGGMAHREFAGDATIDASLAYRRALDRQGTEPASVLDLPQIASRYGLWLADASVNLPFAIGAMALRYAGTARAQWNRSSLPSQDQFSIGGRHTVRGFDGELSLQAERGWFVRNELALALGQSGQEFYAGIDTGQVAGPGAMFLSGRRLSGAALGLRGGLFQMVYEMFLATPLARPDTFATASLTGGFSLSLAF